MRVVVFGATGATGREVVSAARAAGHKIVAVVRDKDRAGDLEAPDVTVVVAELTDGPALDVALAGADAVISAAVDVPGERKALADRVASWFVRRAVAHVVGAKQAELDLLLASPSNGWHHGRLGSWRVHLQAGSGSGWSCASGPGTESHRRTWPPPSSPS